jgi:hypothetical protein
MGRSSARLEISTRARVVGNDYQATATMRRHSSAQRLHAAAHSWQWLIWCLEHWSPQAWQMSAQRWQIALAFSLSRAIKLAARRHIWAQSISVAMQRAIIFTSCSCKQDAAQKSQASAQALQASIHDAYCRVGIMFLRSKVKTSHPSVSASRKALWPIYKA